MPLLSRARDRDRVGCRISRGFTLIELLTVVAIIGILIAIIIPSVNVARDRAQRAVDANNLREIIKAAQIYAGDNNDRLPDPQNLANHVQGGAPVFRWPGILAKNNILTDPTLYFAKNDPAFSGTYPEFIMNPAGQRNQLHPSFVDDRTLAWEFVGGVKMSDPATTPVAYTRGLQSTGAWSASSGVYKEVGGFIGYLGGNVVFYPETTQIFTPNTSTVANKQTDIRAAIPFNSNAALNARLYATPPAGQSTLGTPDGSTQAIQAR